MQLHLHLAKHYAIINTRVYAILSLLILFLGMALTVIYYKNVTLRLSSPAFDTTVYEHLQSTIVKAPIIYSYLLDTECLPMF